MGKDTGIQWTDSTLNLWWGCVEVSPGCDHCYAKDLAARWGRQVWGVNAPRYFTKNWRGTLQSAANKAAKLGVRQRVFVQSMSDICELLPLQHPDRIRMDEERRAFFALAARYTNLDFQLLTKRVGNYAKVVPASWMEWVWPSNVWAGISVVNQVEADRDIPKLLALPAPVKFLSVEPQLGPITFEWEWLRGLQWVISGGESGSQARPFDPDWALWTLQQCRTAHVACFVKQMGRRPVGLSLKDSHGGNWDEWPQDLRVRQFPTVKEPANV